MNNILKTKKVDYVLASDTDSVYITFDTLIEKVKPKNPVDFLDTIAKEKIEPFIDKAYQELADYLHAYEQKMQMKREVIANKGIWVAKKRYMMNVFDEEGVKYSVKTLKEPILKEFLNHFNWDALTFQKHSSDLDIAIQKSANFS